MTYGHSDSPFAWAQKPHPSLRSGPRRKRAVCAAGAAFRHASITQHYASRLGVLCGVTKCLLISG